MKSCIFSREFGWSLVIATPRHHFIQVWARSLWAVLVVGLVAQWHGIDLRLSDWLCVWFPVGSLPGSLYLDGWINCLDIWGATTKVKGQLSLPPLPVGGLWWGTFTYVGWHCQMTFGSYDWFRGRAGNNWSESIELIFFELKRMGLFSATVPTFVSHEKLYHLAINHF